MRHKRIDGATAGELLPERPVLMLPSHQALVQRYADSLTILFLIPPGRPCQSSRSIKKDNDPTVPLRLVVELLGDVGNNVDVHLHPGFCMPGSKHPLLPARRQPVRVTPSKIDSSKLCKCLVHHPPYFVVSAKLIKKCNIKIGVFVVAAERRRSALPHRENCVAPGKVSLKGSSNCIARHKHVLRKSDS